MAKKENRGNNYFEMFIHVAELSCQAAQLLDDAIKHFDPLRLTERLSQIHAVEHEADVAKHDLMHKLAHEFITPIEREDIMRLSQELDDVTDAIEDVLIKMYMFNVQKPRMESYAFADLIVRCCQSLKTAMEEFENFRRSSAIQESIVSINAVEEEGDKLYTEAVHTLFVTCTDPMEVTAWVEVFARLEKCCDACEHVANAIESAIMKNS